MATSQTQKPDRIERKDNVPDNVRTPGKDDAAEKIQRLIIDKGKWPMPYSHIAEEIDWSRQHVKHTVQDYFEEVDTNNKEKTDGGTTTEKLRGKTLEIPEDVENVNDYLRGVIDGSNLD